MKNFFIYLGENVSARWKCKCKVKNEGAGWEKSEKNVNLHTGLLGTWEYPLIYAILFEIMQALKKNFEC